MTASPRMLAGFVQSSLESIDHLDPELGRKVRERLKPDSLDAIESAPPIALISVDLDVELTQCFFDVAGFEQARRALRENLRQSFDKPLLRPLLDGAFALFGRSLARTIRWAPKVWGLIYRDAGQMVVSSAREGHVELTLHDIPLVIATSPTYLCGSAETFAGFFDVVGVEGRVELIGPDLAARRAGFDLTWCA